MKTKLKFRSLITNCINKSKLNITNIMHDSDFYKLTVTFLRRYILVMLLPIILVSILYFKFLYIIKQDTIQANINMLENIKDVFESRMDEIESIGEQVATNTKVMKYTTITEPFAGTNTYKTMETRSYIYDYGLTNNLILDHFVIYLESKVIMSPDQTALLDQFYSHIFAYKDLSYEEWTKEISGSFNRGRFISSRFLDYKGKSYNVLTFIRDLGTTPYGRKCKIMFLLREDEIGKLMNSFDFSGGGYAYIADDDDYLFCNSRAQSDKHRDTFRLPELPENKLFGSEVSYDTKGQKILFTYISSARTGLHYVVVQPYKIVMKKVSYVKTLSFTIIVGAFLLGILISLYLSRRNAKSLKETLKILPKMDEKSEYYKDPFELIQESVYQIIKDNRMLNETIDRQISLLHSSFFQKLRNREFATEDELISYADFIGLNFNGKAFASSIVQIEQLGKVKLKFNDKAMKELDDGRLKVIHVLKEFAYTRNYYSDDKNDLIIIINILDNDNGDQYKQNMISYMQIVRNELMHKYEIDIRFSWGDICINPIDLSYSIQQEVWALDYANSNDIRYDIWYPEFIRSCQNVFFPKEWEDKLMEFTKCGNAEKVKKLIFELQLKNLKKCTMMPESSDLFVHKLYSISMQMVAELSMKRDDVVSLEKILGNRTLDNYIDAVEYITGVFISVCKEVGGNKGQQNSKQMNEICRYVDDNYMNSSLSLSVLAEKFNYSPAYLSLLFKQQTGNNFSCYLEKIRMEHSTRLLKDTDMSIAQISELVGYNSSNSFCRVFKKAFHLSPGQYRQTV